MKRAHVIFEGTVQGVFFRKNAAQMAHAEGVFGWVRNLDDGSVEAVFEGDEGAVRRVIDWCRNNQPHARVKNAKVSWEQPAGEKSFSIKY